jgi:hypothetical protein
MIERQPAGIELAAGSILRIAKRCAVEVDFQPGHVA